MKRKKQRIASYRPAERFTSGYGRTIRPLSVASWLPKCMLIGFALSMAVAVDQLESVAQPAASESPAAAEQTTSTDAFDKALATPATASEDTAADEEYRDPPPPPPYPDPPKNAKRLSKKDRAWIDREQGCLIVDARVSLRRGLLEMFACPPNTKEHESVVAVDSQAFILHAGLLTLGAESGTPVEFTPEYKPPTGTTIEIDVEWKDAQGKLQRKRAQEWIRDARTQKPMKLSWVFAGSSFWRDEETGDQGYQAEGGDLVCVANFGTAMLDVPAEATNDNSGLLFEANTEAIPPLGTPVRLYFKPVLEGNDSKPPEQSAPEPAASTETPSQAESPDKGA